MEPLLIVFGIVMPWLLVCLAVWLGFQFLGQMGRILLRLEALEEQLRQLTLPSLPVAAAPAPAAPVEAPALAIGSEAPAFELPTLTGERASLPQYRGRKLLLIFFNPHCGFCTNMIPALAKLPVDDAGGGPLPLVITTGNAEDTRRPFQEQGVRCPVLIQEQMTIASKYQANGTPMGYLVDEKGMIASPMAVGADALLALATPGGAQSAHEDHAAKGKANLGLEASRINRDGLKAGTPAPDFQLPRLQGGELALRDFRKRRVLLVFSDPQCGPCDELAPHLERIHRERSDIQVLVVSRREPEVNRAKADSLGLTFPIVLQRQWEISTLYGMFATPIGYLVNEEGVIAADVAVGVEPIRGLVGAAAAETAVKPAGAPGAPGEPVNRNGENRHNRPLTKAEHRRARR
jgi:peroxiredoxin